MTLRLAPLLVLVSACQMGALMKSTKEVMTAVLSSVAPIKESNFEKNVCPKAYDGGERGGCFLSKADSSVLADELYDTLGKAGFSARSVLRQDYLAWTSTFDTKDKRFSFLMRVDPLENAPPDDQEKQRWLAQGYRSEVTFSVYDNNVK